MTTLSATQSPDQLLEAIRQSRLDSARQLALEAAGRILAAADDPAEAHAALWRLVAALHDMAGVVAYDAEKITGELDAVALDTITA